MKIKYFMRSCFIAIFFVSIVFNYCKTEAYDAASYTSELTIKTMIDEFGAKKTKDGFYYTMDSNVIEKGFESYYKSNGISKKLYKNYSKKYNKKKKCCYIVSYMGNKKNIRLPDQIEGCSNYVLNISGMGGLKRQVKKVTIPADVRIVSVLHDNPLGCLGWKWSYIDTRYFSYTYNVEKSNASVKSVNGLLYSSDGKILYGIPSEIKGSLVIPDTVETAYFTDVLYGLSGVVLGKNTSQIIYNNTLSWKKLSKIKVKNGNRYFKAIDNTLYSKDMKKLYFSVSKKKGSFKMPDSIEKIGKGAFYQTGFSEIITSDRLKNLPAFAFNDEKLEKLVIGKNVSKINKSAVRSDQIKKLILNKDNKYFVISGKYLYDKNMKKKYIYINS